MKRTIALAAAVLMLAGCAATGDKVAGETSTTSPAAETSSAPTTTAPATTPTPEATTEESAKDTTTIGKTLVYESGFAVRVVSVKLFNPGQYAVGLETGHRAVKVTWTLTNGTDANVDLSGATARLTYGADGTQAEAVYTDGVGGMYPFEGSLRPKQKKTATSAFSVPKAGLSQVVVEVEPEFNSETAFFTGKVAAK